MSPCPFPTTITSTPRAQGEAKVSKQFVKNMLDTTGAHNLNFLYHHIAIRSSCSSSHLRPREVHMFYKYTTYNIYNRELKKKQTNKQRLRLGLSVRRERFWYFSGIQCFCGYHEHVPERNSHTAIRNADSFSRTG